jgi:hypothetical protein
VGLRPQHQPMEINKTQRGSFETQSQEVRLLLRAKQQTIRNWRLLGQVRMRRRLLGNGLQRVSLNWKHEKSSLEISITGKQRAFSQMGSNLTLKRK